MPEIAGKVSGRPGVTRPRATGSRRPRRNWKPRSGVALVCTAVAAGLLCAACSLDYQAAIAEEQAAEGIPDTVATDLVHRIHRDGRLSLQLEAARAETFNSRNETVLKNAHFIEFDSSGGKATEGKAERVIYHSDTENAEISGAVRVYSAAEKGDVSAETLAWKNKEKRLSAPPDERVLIRKDDGSFISGRGFQGDFRTRQVSFSGPVRGSYVWEEMKE
jgi:LPS export ABC transporter protein LptC